MVVKQSVFNVGSVDGIAYPWALATIDCADSWG